MIAKAQDTTRRQAMARTGKGAMRSAALATTALAAIVTASPALAQQEAAETADNVIIVTAQRRAEALEDVPMTIAALSQDALEASGVTSVRDISKVVTGLQLGQSGGFPQPAIRGVTTLLTGTTFENNVAIYIDGFYQVAPQTINIDLPNIESVQVLKGPQGTLYGRNATGGAILLNTVSPKDSWEGKAELTYARFDDKRASAYVAGPLGEGVGVSLAGYIRRSDGWIRFASRTVPGETEGNATPLEQDAVRAKLHVDLASNLTATLGYNYTHILHGIGNQFAVYENVAPIYNSFPGGATRPTRLGVSAWDIDARTETFQHEGTLTLALDTAIGQLKSYTGYSSVKPIGNFDFDGSYINLTWSTSEFRQKTFQQAIDYSIDAIDNLDLIFGGTYFRDNLRTIGPHIARFSGRNPTAPGTTPPTAADLIQTGEDRFKQVKEAWAVYGDATLHIADRLALNVGARYSKETQDVTAMATNTTTGVVTFPLTSKGSSYSKFTPRASIRYELAPRTNVYASFSKGFRSGAWNASLPATPALWLPADQESVDAYEVGFKTAGNRFRFELAGFYYDYTNLQVSLTRTVGNPPQPLVLISNAPSAEIYGVEGSFEYEVVDNFTVRAGATWLHARYGDNFFFVGTGVDPSRVGINSDPNPLKTFLNVTQPNQDLSGLQMARSPDFTANFGFDYLIPRGDGGLRFAANAYYTDSYVVTNPSVWGPLLNGTQYESSARKQRWREGNYVLLGGSITWTDPKDQFYVRVFGNNLTDHRYRLHYNGTSTFGTYAPMAEPLTYGVTVGIKFREDYAPPPPPMAEAPPPPAPVAPPPVQVTCNKGPYIVFFDWDKSDITPEASTVLDSAVTAYGNCDSVPIMLAGHADRSGGAAYNVGLSERRNGSVRSYLNARGIPDGSISSQAFGESQPRVPTADGVRELQNRRVEITYGPGSGF